MNVRNTFNAASWFVDRNVEHGRGTHVAIECGEERLTYADVLERVNRVGHALRHELHVQPGDRVLLLTLDGWEMVCAFFGAIKIGAIPVPLNTLWKAPDYEYILDDSRAVALIVSAALLPKIVDIPSAKRSHLRHIIVVGEGSVTADAQSFGDLLQASLPDTEAELTTRESPAFWVYSSGSTGAPKACVHRHRDMVASADAYARTILGITNGDRCYSVAKLFFSYGLGNALYFPFSVGATAILTPVTPTPAEVFAIIERHRPTLFFSVPTNYAMLLAHPREGREFDLSSVRLAISAGEALPAALFERFRQRFRIDILDGIGSTEILHIFMSNRPGGIRPGSSGRPVPGYEVRLVDEQNRAVAPGDVGNLLVKGESICAGYWEKPEKTRETFDGEWIRTGDKYRQDPDGFFWYEGRTDDMLKVGGMWVSPVEIENLLVEHPAVLECAVCGRDDRDGLTKPIAHVVLRAGVASTSELALELQQFVRQRTAEYKRPRWVEFVAALPKTATGKTQRFKLRERVSV